MIVTVTQGDIDKGFQFSPYSCPIARALKRTRCFPKLRVGRDRVTYGKDVSVKLPSKVQRFIANFDYGRPVKPFSFRLNMPKEKRNG